MSILPVPRRLDSSRLPHGLDLNGEPTPVMEALAFSTSRKLSEVRAALRQDTVPVAADPKRGRRSSNGVWPQRRWLRGQMLWQAACAEEEGGVMDAEVQAFGLCAGGFVGHAFEAVTPLQVRGAPSQPPKQRDRGGPSHRHGVLTHCALQALEEMNFQGSYYALWWRANRIMRREGHTDQHFQLTFSEGTDPTAREVFEPLGEAEARAYARRTELERVLEGQEANRGDLRCAG